MRALLVLAALSLPSLALAAKPKVVLDAPKAVGAALEKALKGKYAVSKAQLAPEPTGGDVKDACRTAGGAIAVVTARQGGDLYTVMVLNGADGSPLATFRLRGGKKPLKALPKPNAKALMEGLSEAKAPGREAPKPPPEETKPPPEETKPEDKPVAEKKPEERSRPKPSEPPPPPAEEIRSQPEEEVATTPSKKEKPQALRLGVGFKMFDRRFGYRDDLFDALSTYYLPIGPAVGGDLELFPAAFVTSSFAANVGVQASFDYAVGIASRAEDGTRYGTQALNVRASLTARIPVSVLTIQPFVGFSRQTYSISSSTGVKPNIPSVGYNALRPGLLLKLKIFGPVSLQLGAAYQALLQTGEIGAYFPRARAGGLDAGGALTVGLMERLEVRLAGEYQRYWFSMNPEPGDTYVAGGALDIFVSGTLSVAFTL